MDVKLTHHLKEEDFLELWKYFQDHADHIKERMWTISGWLYALLTGLLGFIFENNVKLQAPEGAEPASLFYVSDPLTVGLLLLIGLGLCVYIYLLQDGYGGHILKNWIRSNRILENHPELKKIYLMEGDTLEVPRKVKDAVYLKRFTAAFGVLIAGLVVVVLIG